MCMFVRAYRRNTHDMQVAYTYINIHTSTVMLTHKSYVQVRRFVELTSIFKKAYFEFACTYKGKTPTQSYAVRFAASISCTCVRLRSLILSKYENHGM
jgi:hypothetical protein